ncbi:3'-5' exonuclease [bacterium]|nr:3'-5' exonuclease [bacterium]NDC96165.1 3'-5' exonuclease [bacterium]NDD84790.1 3'-5' exonuclease [bacterium]NDG32945.1 3'-5' exonuclease [bacterium]
MNNNKICVFDFETDGSDPDSCSPVQIAAVMIDPISLQVIDGSEFNVNFKPEVIEANENYEYTTDILDFHAKVRGCSKQDILDQWKKYPKQEYSWKLFTNYLDNYHSRSSRKSQFSAPIAAGYNIHRFDLRIIERLSQKYKNLNKENRSDIFYPRDTVDIMSLMFYWFEASNELKSYSLDTVREYFGIDKHGAHDALKDVKDCAELLTRFLKLHRNLSSKIKFRNSFVENS